MKKIDFGKFLEPTTLVFITVFLFFAAQFFASMVFVFISIGAGWDSSELTSWVESSSFPQLFYLLIADSLILGGLWYVLKLTKRTFKDIGLAWPKLGDLWRAVGGYFVYIVVFLILSTVAKMLVPSLNLEQEQQLGFEAKKGILDLIVAGIGLIILPPIVEEILSRGFLYTGLRRTLKVIPAAIVTSIVFAAAHLQFGSDAPLLWVAAIDTFVLSLVLVYLRETTGKLAAPMLLHGIKNAVAFSLLFIFI